MSQFTQYEMIEKTIIVENILQYKEAIENPEINIWGQVEKYEKSEINLCIDDKKIMVKKIVHSMPLHSTDEININIDLYSQEKHIANCEICIDIDTKIKDPIGYKLVKIFDIESYKTPEIREYKVSLRKGEWDTIMGMKLASKNTLK